MSHIEKKLQTLKKLTGDEIDISLNDLRSDFDPKEYDRRMKVSFLLNSYCLFFIILCCYFFKL